MKIGYARTSTDDQTTALQMAALKKAWCTKIFEYKGISGTIKKRPALTRCLAALQSGDTLTIWKLDRLGRSLRDLIDLIDHLDDLRARGVRFQSITEAIDTETPTGRAMWQFVGVLAELERSMITERTRAGVKEAKKRGVTFGRKPKLTPAQIKHARQQIDKGERPQDVAALLNVHKATLYRALKE
jgi:DNA invertase Pin-like site-specific DNA recombinase